MCAGDDEPGTEASPPSAANSGEVCDLRCNEHDGDMSSKTALFDEGFCLGPSVQLTECSPGYGVKHSLHSGQKAH